MGKVFDPPEGYYKEYNSLIVPFFRYQNQYKTLRDGPEKQKVKVLMEKQYVLVYAWKKRDEKMRERFYGDGASLDRALLGAAAVGVTGFLGYKAYKWASARAARNRALAKEKLQKYRTRSKTLSKSGRSKTHSRSRSKSGLKTSKSKLQRSVKV